MSHTSWMIERLNGDTRSFHPDAEADFDILFSPDATVAHYREFLARAYGFEAPLEAMLSTTPNLDLMIDLRERQKAGYLAQDLLGLGMRPAELSAIPHCLTIPQFTGAAEALGWMYVVERTTLAYSIIRRHLATRMPREIRRASAYLSCYTGVVGTRWRQFGATLDLVGRHPAIAERIASAALEGFAAQRRWAGTERRSTRTVAV
jgi:heme oxygenase (biliverdin-IX-beta and delta-forming)